MFKRGFTLIEVLTVILIIGILTTITTFTYNASLSRSRDSQRLTDLKSVQNALEQYYLDKREYPNVQVPVNQDYVSSYPWVAKYELELFAPGSWSCTQPTDGTKTFLAPRYIATMPEDPQYKLALEGGDGGCRIVAPQGRSRGSRQYMYAPLSVDYESDDRDGGITDGYYLLARMERANNTTTSLGPIRSRLQAFDFTKKFINLPGGNVEYGRGTNGWGEDMPSYYYCSKNGIPTDDICDFNYFLSNKDR